MLYGITLVCSCDSYEDCCRMQQDYHNFMIEVNKTCCTLLLQFQYKKRDT